MSTRFSALMDEQKADKKAGFGGCSDIGNFNRPRPIERHNPFTPDRSTSNRTGFGNPRDWHTTHQPPSQNPIQNPPRGFDPNGFRPDLNTGAKWLATGVLGHQLYENVVNRPNSTPPKTDTTHTSPQYKPHGPR